MNNKKRILFILCLSTLLVNIPSAKDSINPLQYYYNIDKSCFYDEESQDILINDDTTLNVSSSIDEILDSENEMVPQGLTIMNDYILVSAYEYNKKDNSYIYVFDMNGNKINSFKLQNSAHVGGISYDSKNQLIWVSSNNGSVDAYNSNDILEMEENIPKFDDLDLGDGLTNYIDSNYNSVSFLTTYDNYLYVGNYSLINYGLLKKYSINFENNNKRIILKLENTYKIPSKVQGVTFINRNDNIYMVLSRSCSRRVTSIMQIYKFSDDIKDYNKNKNYIAYEIPPMVEQTALLDNQIYELYESNAKPYKSNKNNKTLTKSLIKDIISD